MPSLLHLISTFRPIEATTLTLERGGKDAKQVHDTPLRLDTLERLGVCHAKVACAIDGVQPLAVLVEKVRKLLRAEAALVVVRARVAAVLAAVDLREVDAEERVGQPAPRGERDVREAAVDDDGGEEREQQRPAEQPEADECFPGRDDTVAVEVEEVAVLLEDLLWGKRRDESRCDKGLTD